MKKIQDMNLHIKGIESSIQYIESLGINNTRYSIEPIEVTICINNDFYIYKQDLYNNLCKNNGINLLVSYGIRLCDNNRLIVIEPKENGLEYLNKLQKIKEAYLYSVFMRLRTVYDRQILIKNIMKNKNKLFHEFEPYDLAEEYIDEIYEYDDCQTVSMAYETYVKRAYSECVISLPTMEEALDNLKYETVLLQNRENIVYNTEIYYKIKGLVSDIVYPTLKIKTGFTETPCVYGSDSWI